MSISKMGEENITHVIQHMVLVSARDRHPGPFSFFFSFFFLFFLISYLFPFFFFLLFLIFFFLALYKMCMYGWTYLITEAPKETVKVLFSLSTDIAYPVREVFLFTFFLLLPIFHYLSMSQVPKVENWEHIVLSKTSPKPSETNLLSTTKEEEKEEKPEKPLSSRGPLLRRPSTSTSDKRRPSTARNTGGSSAPGSSPRARFDANPVKVVFFFCFLFLLILKIQ